MLPGLRDQRRDVGVGAGLDVGLAEIAAVRQQALGRAQRLRQAGQRGKRRFDLAFVVGRLDHIGGDHQPPGKHHVIRVDAITHRRRPLYHTIVGGALEHLVLGEIPREATLLAHLKRSFPNVLDVHLPRGGVCRYHLVVRIDKRQESEAKNIMMGAFAGHYDVKRVVVVDADVDIYDTEEVEWAIATRFQANRDLLVIAGAQGSKLDPTTEDGFGAKMGLDATVPLAADPFTFTRIRVPGEAEIEPEAHVDAGADIEAWLAEDER